jgi:hypothetical protein
VKFFSEIRALLQGVDIVIAERLSAVDASFAITCNMFLSTVDAFREIIELAPIRDKVHVTLMNDSDDIVKFANCQSEAVDYSSLTDELLAKDIINVKIQIDKAVSEGKFSIYDYESFVTDLLPRSLPEIIGWFSRLLSGQESLQFEAFDYDISFSTRTMAFESSEDASFRPTVNRAQRLNDCKDSAYFYNMNTYEVIPDDFIIQGIVRANTRLQMLFGKIATILSLAYVSSSSSIEDSKMKIHINGQRTVNYAMSLVDIFEDDKWQNVYTWIFTDGNPTDKALIARNVISLHCKFETILNLDAAVFDAIKTNYNLYLRNNVDKYLDMKRDIAKFIRDVVAQVGEHAVSMLNKFKNNLLAIFGLLFTIVLTRIGNSQKWDDIFTRDTLYLIEAFFIGSLIYLFICFFETQFKLKKIEEAYCDLKANYKDALSKAELNEAFEDDKLLKNTKKSVNKGMISWSFCWGLSLIVMIVIIECFTANHGLIVWLWTKIV